MNRVALRVLAVGAFAATLAGSATASAHVDVLPTRVGVEQATEFTARVPNERDVPVVRVRVLFPPQVTVFSIAAVPGWAHRRLVAKDQTLKGVVYTGGRIGVGGYTDFTFLGTAFKKGTAVWKAEQTYADGITKPWTSPPEREGAVSEETGPSDPGPAAGTLIGAPLAAAAAVATTDSTSSSAGIWLGLIAITIAVGAALAAGFLWSTRPVSLPPDEPDETPAPRARRPADPRGPATKQAARKRRRRG